MRSKMPSNMRMQWPIRGRRADNDDGVPRMKAMLAAFAGALFGATMVLVAEGMRTPPSPTLTSAEVAAIVRKENAALRDPIAQLTHDIEALRLTPDAARVEVASSPTPPLDLGPITSRLDALSKQLDMMALATDRNLATQKFPDPKPTSLSDDQRVAADRRATEKERIAALQRLRGMQTADGQDARSHDVVLSMVDIAEHSEDADSRLDVYRNLHGVNDSAAKDSMLRALARDQSAKVREKVAEDIESYLDDPQVKNALQVAANSDADADVRSMAAITLAGGKRKKH